MKFKEVISEFTDDELISAEDEAFKRYLKEKGDHNRLLALAIWIAIDNECMKRCNGNPFARKDN